MREIVLISEFGLKLRYRVRSASVEAWLKIIITDLQIQHLARYLSYTANFTISDKGIKLTHNQLMEMEITDEILSYKYKEAACNENLLEACPSRNVLMF